MFTRVLNPLLMVLGLAVLVACQPKQEPPLSGQKVTQEKLDDLICEGDLCQMPVVLIVHREAPVCMGVVVSDREVLTSARCLGVTNASRVSVEDLAEDLSVVLPRAADQEREELSVLSISAANGAGRNRLVRLRVSRELTRRASGHSPNVARPDSDITIITPTPATLEDGKNVLKLQRQTGCKTIATPVFYPYDLKEDALGVVLKNCFLEKYGRGALAIDRQGRIAGLIEASFDGNKIYEMIVESYRDLLNWEGAYNRNFALLNNSRCWDQNQACAEVETPTADFLRQEMAGIFLNSDDKLLLQRSMARVQGVRRAGLTWQLDSRVVADSRILLRPVPNCYIRADWEAPFNFPRELRDFPKQFSSSYLEAIPTLNEDFQIKISRIDNHMENLNLLINWKSSPIDARMTIRWSDFYFQNTYSVTRCMTNEPTHWELRNSPEATTNAVQQVERLTPNFEELFTDDTLF